MIISSIAAVSENGVIGKNNDLPWHLPDDFKWFKDKTKGHAIVLGRKNFESLHGALPHRTNIVLSRQPDLQLKGCTVVTTLDEAIAIAKAQGEEELFIIGGQQIYELAMPLVDRLYITIVHADVDGDTFFPEIPEEWKMKWSEHHAIDDRHDFAFTFTILEKD